MKNLVILGGGTGGTMVANHLNGEMPKGWTITVVDPSKSHLYQPGLLFLPFGARDEDRMVKPRAKTLQSGIDWVKKSVELVDTDSQEVVLEGDERLHYDLLVLASGSQIRPEETPGLLGDEWRQSIHDFYTLEGAQALRETLATFEGGRLVVDVVEMPIKCPVAPLEFLFLADDFFKKRGIRDRVELVYATPLDGAFTKPVCSNVLSYLLAEKGIRLETEFNAAEVDAEGHVLSSYDERRIPYDLLVSVPTHMGAPFIEASGLGDELAFVPTDHHTLLAEGHNNIFVIGDATNVPASKAGSVAHFQSEIVTENILHTVNGRSLHDGFDGHANCFIETGGGKGLLIDFNYFVEPMPGHYPLPAVGPFTLLGESRRNHWGKLAFRWIYWNALLPARPLPVPNRMSLVGKKSVHVHQDLPIDRAGKSKAA
ncbi:MAG: FAD-dependent oxidoreductase [Acidobacteriota bacterium]|nr:FAD-dependent oxidoreductase [Acidobacteriota bacterium]